MNIFLLGVNHRTTPVQVRGKFAIGSDELEDALVNLRNYVSQGVILCTCNRTEVYILANEGDPDLLAAREFLNFRAGLPEVEIKKFIYALDGAAAVRHLMRVASGLDSMIVGEYEILGQVRRSLEAAERTGVVNFPLLELFRAAVKAGRRVRAQTGISRNALSVSSAAVSLAIQAAGDLHGRRIVVIGAGEAGKLVAKSCRERGARDVVVVSRSQAKGTALAASLHGRWAPMAALGSELEAADLVISCSGAPHTILKLELVRDVMKARPGRRLVIIDIAVPPDVDAGVGRLADVFLYDIDKLTEVCRTNRGERRKDVRKAEDIVDEETARFMSFWDTLGVRPVIKSLVTKVEGIRRAQLALTLKRLKSISAADRTSLEAMTRSIVQQVLGDPIRCLKNNHKDQDYSRIISELFGLTVNGGRR